MPHEIVTWRLHKKGVVLVVIGVLLFTALVFAAGYMTALMRGAARPKPVAVKKPALPAKPAPPPTTTTTTQAATIAAKPVVIPETLTLQVAIFGSEEEAAAFVKELAKMELEGNVVSIPTRDGPVLYGVETGEYKSRREALAAAETVQEKHGLQATVVPATPHKINGSAAPK